MSLSIRASRRALRPLCLTIISFAPFIISAAVSPALPFSVCVFFFLGYLSAPRTRFLAGAVPVTIVDDEVTCSGGGRVSEIGEGARIVDVEAQSLTCLPQVSSNWDGSLFIELSSRLGRPRPCFITAGSQIIIRALGVGLILGSVAQLPERK